MGLWMWLFLTLIAVGLVTYFTRRSPHGRYWTYGVLFLSIILYFAPLPWGYIFPQTNVEQTFMNFVPANDQGAPHDMQYLVEEATGQLGYYGTKYIPGTVVVSKSPNGGHTIDWTINGEDFRFTLSASGVLTGDNSAAQSIRWYEYGATPPPQN